MVSRLTGCESLLENLNVAKIKLNFYSVFEVVRYKHTSASFPFQGPRAAGVYHCCHRIRGRLHPGQVTNGPTKYQSSTFRMFHSESPVNLTCISLDCVRNSSRHQRSITGMSYSAVGLQLYASVSATEE